MELVDRVQELVARVEALDDAAARETVHELLGAMLELYGDGLERIFAALDAAGAAGSEVKDSLSIDPVVSSLLLIHGLYPVPLETRVDEALDRVRPYLRSHGGDVELLALEDGVARLRLQGTCDGCPSSAATLELAIAQELEQSAPDLLDIEVEGITERAAPAFSGKQLPLAGAASDPPAPAWAPIELDGLDSGATTRISLNGTRLLIANLGGTLLAYRDACAGCGAPLAGGELDGGLLECPSCRRQFALPLAGRIVGGDEPLQLVPVPLLEEDGSVRVALRS